MFVRLFADRPVLPLARAGALLTLLLTLFWTASAALAASPDVQSLLPRGGQRGTSVIVHFRGQHIDDAQAVLFYGDGIAAAPAKKSHRGELDYQFTIAADARLGEHLLRLRTASGISEATAFWVGEFPQVQPTHSQSDFAHPTPIAMNVTVNASLPSEQVAYYSVQGKKGQRLSAEVEGMRLGGRLFDPQLSIIDTRRFELVSVDDTALLLQDPFASIVLPADGTYIIAVRDSTYAGGNFEYRLHVGDFPRPTMIYPAGGPPGQTVAVDFLGDPLGPIHESLKVPPLTDDPRIGLFVTQKGPTSPSPNYFRVSDMPNVLQTPDNTTLVRATDYAGELPVAFNGIIAHPRDENYFSFAAKRGHPIDVHVYARQLRSPLDSVLSILDAHGNQLAYNDDSGGPDSFLRFNPPADGKFFIRITDQLRAGGPDYVYRIELTAPFPEAVLQIPAPQNRREYEPFAVIVPRGNLGGVIIRARRESFGGPLALQFPDLPPGVTFSAAPMDARVDAVPVIFDAAPNAAMTAKLCELTAKSADGKSPALGRYEQDFVFAEFANNNPAYGAIVHRLTVVVTDAAPFALRVEQPKTPLVQNGSMAIKVIATRKPGFDKPIQLRLMWGPPGVNADVNSVIPAGQTSATIAIGAAGNAMEHQWKTAVSGAIDDNGQLVIASPLFDLSVAKAPVTAQIAISAAEQGQSTQVVCQLDQQSHFDGKATIELLGLPDGATAAPQQISASDKQVVFDVATTPKVQAGQHNSLFCQITVVDAGQPIVWRSGQGGLRIDPPDGHASSASVKPPKPGDKPLSRLEKLRLEQKK